MTTSNTKKATQKTTKTTTTTATTKKAATTKAGKTAASKPAKPAAKTTPKTTPKTPPKKSDKPAIPTPIAVQEDKPAIVNPFRAGCSYGLVFEILAKHPEGITRAKLLEELKALSPKADKLLNYDISVVVSSRQTGEAHKSISRKADLYYVEKGEGGFLKLHMRS